MRRHLRGICALLWRQRQLIGLSSEPLTVDSGIRVLVPLVPQLAEQVPSDTLLSMMRALFLA